MSPYVSNTHSYKIFFSPEGEFVGFKTKFQETSLKRHK